MQPPPPPPRIRVEPARDFGFVPRAAVADLPAFCGGSRMSGWLAPRLDFFVMFVAFKAAKPPVVFSTPKSSTRRELRWCRINTKPTVPKQRASVVLGHCVADTGCGEDCKCPQIARPRRPPVGGDGNAPPALDKSSYAKQKEKDERLLISLSLLSSWGNVELRFS